MGIRSPDRGRLLSVCCPHSLDSFFAWSLRIGNRNLPRSPGRQNPRWKRRRDAGRGYQTTSQEFPAEDEGAGNSCGTTFRIFKTLDFFYYTATYNTNPIHSTSESMMMEKKPHIMPCLPHGRLPNLRAFTISHPPLDIPLFPFLASRTKIPRENKLHNKQAHPIRNAHTLLSNEASCPLAQSPTNRGLC
jgi:hypothetical protein